MKMTRGTNFPFGARISHSHCQWGENSKTVLLVTKKEKRKQKGYSLIPFPTVSLWLANSDMSISSTWLWPWTEHPDQSLNWHCHTLCFPVVPVRICNSVGFYGPLGWRAGVLGGLLGLRRARVQQRRWFVRMEGPAVVVWPRWTCWPVLWHPPEVLRRAFSSLMVVGMEVITTSPFGVWMPEIQ